MKLNTSENLCTQCPSWLKLCIRYYIRNKNDGLLFSLCCPAICLLGTRCAETASLYCDDSWLRGGAAHSALGPSEKWWMTKHSFSLRPRSRNKIWHCSADVVSSGFGDWWMERQTDTHTQETQRQTAEMEIQMFTDGKNIQLLCSSSSGTYCLCFHWILVQ